MATETNTVITKMELDTTQQDKALKDTTKEEKKLQEQTKKTTKAAEDQSGALAGLTGQLDKMTGGALSSVKGLGGMVKGFKSLRVAIAATGIGALLLAFSSLVAFFKSSEEGQDKLNKIMNVFGVIVGNISDLVANFGGAIIEAFENPKQTIKELGEFIKTNIENRFKALGKIGAAIAKIFSKDWKEGFKDLGDAGIQAFTGVEDAIGKASRAAAGFLEETRREVAESKRVSDLAAATDRLEREQLVRRSKLESEIAEQRLKSRQDDQFTATERIAFLNEAQRLSDILLATDQQIAANRLEEQQITNSFSKSTKENKDAEAAAEAELNNITTRRLNEQRALERELFRVRGQQRKEEEEIEKVRNEKDAERAEIQNELADTDLEKALERIKIKRDAEIEAADLAAENFKNRQADEVEARKATMNALGKISSEVASFSKETALFNIALRTAEAIVEVAPNPFAIAAAVAVGAIQASNVLSAPEPNAPRFDHGGMIGGSLHSSGGTLIEAERGEAIINRRSMASPLLANLASAINQAGGGVAFAQRGMLVGGQSELSQLGSSFNSSLKNNSIVLVTEDLDRVQGRVLVTENTATL